VSDYLADRVRAGKWMSPAARRAIATYQGPRHRLDAVLVDAAVARALPDHARAMRRREQVVSRVAAAVEDAAERLSDLATGDDWTTRRRREHAASLARLARELHTDGHHARDLAARVATPASRPPTWAQYVERLRALGLSRDAARLVLSDLRRAAPDLLGQPPAQ